MSIISATIEAKSRSLSGKGPARRTRAEGLVPGTVYGKHLDKPFNIAVNGKELRAAINTPKKLNTVLGLKVDGKEHAVLVKDYQLEPVTKELLHADFIAVRENEQVKVKLPVVLTGKSIGVAEGGMVKLGELGEEEEELDELGERIKKLGLPPDVEKVATKELNRLKSIPTASSEYYPPRVSARGRQQHVRFRTGPSTGHVAISSAVGSGRLHCGSHSGSWRALVRKTLCRTMQQRRQPGAPRPRRARGRRRCRARGPRRGSPGPSARHASTRRSARQCPAPRRRGPGRPCSPCGPARARVCVCVCAGAQWLR